MTTALLSIRLDYDQVLALVQQLSDEDKLQLNRELSAEVRRIELQSLLETFKNNDITMEEITSELEQIRQARYEEKRRNSNNS